jgi:hypothetical protein
VVLQKIKSKLGMVVSSCNYRKRWRVPGYPGLQRETLLERKKPF